MVNDVEYVIVCLLDIYIPFLVKCLFMSFTHFLIELLFVYVFSVEF